MHKDYINNDEWQSSCDVAKRMSQEERIMLDFKAMLYHLKTIYNTLVSIDEEFIFYSNDIKEVCNGIKREVIRREKK